MKTRYVRLALLPLAFGVPLFAQTPEGGSVPTFTRDVLPLVQKHCQICHRPGEAAPFSLLTYEQARPWAKAIRTAVLQRKMPPWFADPHYGKFSNDASLDQKDIKTIAAWVDAGAPKGDLTETTPAREFVHGWAIPQPDAVIELRSAFTIPATGTVEYQHILIPAPFKEDKWVQFAEARPGDRSRVHHIIAFIREPGSTWLKDAKPGIPFVPEKAKSDENTDTSELPSDFWLVTLPDSRLKVSKPARASSSRPGQTSFSRSTTQQTERRARTAAASGSCSQSNRLCSASLRYRRRTASSKSPRAMRIIGWMLNSRSVPT